jgi:hypothetical protein
MDSTGKPDSLLVRLRVLWMAWEPSTDVGIDFEGDVGETFAVAPVVALGGDRGGVCGFFATPVMGNALIDKEEVAGRLRTG